MSNLLPVIDKLNIGQIQGGKNSTIFTSKGEYVDMFCDNGVVSMGYDFVEDITPHLPNAYKFDLREKAAKKLCEISNMDYAFFSTSGTGSVEAMMKFARKHQHPDRKDIYFLNGAFHGRTYGTMSADFTGKSYHIEGYEPLLPGVKKFNKISEIDKKAAAVIVTPAELYGNYKKYEEGWLKKLEKYCHKHNILLGIDEVQTYIRNGKDWGFQVYNDDIKPDMIATAKGIAGGYPTGVTLIKKEIGDSISKGGHFSTFGGNITSVCGILEVLKQKDYLKNRASVYGDKIKFKLKQIKGANNIRGEGLMVVFDVDNPLDLRNKCLEKHVILGVFSNSQSIKLTPSLTIESENINYVLEVLKECL